MKMSSSPIIIHTGRADFALDALSADLDREFAAFYKAGAAGFQPDTVSFDKAAAEYFDERGDTPGEIDRFFFNFTPLWSGLVAERRLPDATEVWKWALRPALEWEGRSSRRLHKGAAYYFERAVVLARGPVFGFDVDAGLAPACLTPGLPFGPMLHVRLAAAARCCQPASNDLSGSAGEHSKQHAPGVIIKRQARRRRKRRCRQGDF
jgi:hypothetical protein